MDQNAILRFNGVTSSPKGSSNLCKDGGCFINNPHTNHNSSANHAANPSTNHNSSANHAANPADEGADHHHYSNHNNNILASFANDHINTYLYMNQSAAAGAMNSTALRPHPNATNDPNNNNRAVNSCEDDANPLPRNNNSDINMISNQLDPSHTMAVNHLFSSNSCAADNNINPSRCSSDNSHLINKVMEDHNHNQNHNHNKNRNHNHNYNHNHNQNHNHIHNHNRNHNSHNDDDTTTAISTNDNDDDNNNNGNNNNNNNNHNKSSNASAVSAEEDDMSLQRAKIVAHPYFPRLLHAYTNYYKIGAPPEVICRLDEIREEYNRSHHRHDHDLDHDDKNHHHHHHHHPLLLMASSAAPTATNCTASAVGDDPELDEFMHVYSEVLERQVGGMSRCLEEAQAFLKRMEAQLLITLSSLKHNTPSSPSRNDPGGTNSNMNSGDEEEILEDGSCCEADYKNMNANIMAMGATNTNTNESELQQLQQQALLNHIHMNANHANHNMSSTTTANYNDGNHTNKPNNAIMDDDDDDDDENDDDGVDDEAKIRMNMGSMNGMIDPVLAHEDQVQLKQQLLRKYSGFMICSLKKEFLKRKKKGKLPKEARQKLLEWWTQHYKWPYPSENEKAALAEVTGLNQKQINNWFINQRKRHWKPSEDLHYVMIDTNDLHNSGHPQMAMPNMNMNMNMNMNANMNMNMNMNTNMNVNASASASASAPNLHNHNMPHLNNNNTHDMLGFGQTSATNAASGLL